MKKIIIDTDPGIDDAMAIAYAVAHPGIELLGLTTIFGNVTVGQATENALRLLDFLEHDAPVARGEDRPLVQAPNLPSREVHGENGLGGHDLPATGRAPAALDAARFLVETTRAHPHDVTICAVGPLTNLARALSLDPTIASRIREVVVMGGAIHHIGNVTPGAEANFWNDPHAAAAVLGADWPVVVAPLDCTMPVVFTPDFMASLANAAPKVGGMLAAMAGFYSTFYRGTVGLDGCVPHDVMALTWLTAPGVFLQRIGAMDVTTEGPGRGQLHFLPAGRASRDPHWQSLRNRIALMDTDARLFRADYFRTITEAERERSKG